MSGEQVKSNADDQPTFYDRVAFTPLSNALRGDWKKRPTVERILRAHALPPAVAQCIRTIVERSRLWRMERHDVARELAAHFADGLEAGRSAEDLMESFGDPEQAARLIRITKKRNRPLWWRASRNTLRGFAAMVVLLIVLYAAVTIRFFMGSPTISHDYVQDLNRVAASVPDDQRAWPIYRTALLALGERPLIVREEHPTVEEPVSEEYRQYLERNAAALELVREAGSMPHFGYEVGHDISEADRELWPDLIAGDPQRGVYSALLPFLGTMRELSWVIAANAIRAAEDGDMQTTVRSVEATIGMTEHLREHPVLISDLVALAIFTRMLDTISGILEVHADRFTDDDLTTIAHLIASACGGDVRVRIESERFSFHDFLQRTYTDDGGGGGRLTPEGVRLISDLMMISSEEVNESLKWALSPGASLVMANRREMKAKWDELFNEMLADASLPLWQRTFPTNTFVEMMKGTFAEKRYLPIVLLFPAIARASNMADRAAMRRDGVLVALALELYHRHHGAWPQTLSDLTPNYLPAVPMDRFDGHPLRYLVREGQPIVYSIGINLEDDGGVPLSPDNLNETARFVPRAKVDARNQDFKEWKERHPHRTDITAPFPEADFILWPRLPSNWAYLDEGAGEHETADAADHLDQ